MTPQEIANTLKFLRKEQRMSQEQLAEKTGIPRQTIADWEAGRKLPDQSDLEKMGDVYHMDLSTLVVTEKPTITPEEKAKSKKMMHYNVAMIAAVLVYFALVMFTGTYSVRSMILMMAYIVANQIATSILANAQHSNKTSILPAVPKSEAANADTGVFQYVIAKIRSGIAMSTCILLWITVVLVLFPIPDWVFGVFFFVWLAAAVLSFLIPQYQNLKHLVSKKERTLCGHSLHRFTGFISILWLLVFFFWIWFSISGLTAASFVLFFVLLAADLVWYAAAKPRN